MEKCLRYIKLWGSNNNLSMAIPYGIGCGIANGDWNKVYKIIEEVFSDYDIGYNIDLEGRGKVKRVTCDKKLCTECATKINNKDYCKKHIQDLKKELGGILSERK